MRTAAYLRSQAAKCRELASETDDQKATAGLLKLADDYEQEAEKVAQTEKGPTTTGR